MSWYSNIASRVNNSVTSLQRSVFASEADGDTEDDTHVCRVLRTYYTEKGQSFPQWLPPDPKAPPPIVVQQSAPQSRYGNVQNGAAQQPGGGGLSSLWDRKNAASAPPGSPGGPPARTPFGRNSDAAAAAGGRPATAQQRLGSYQSANSVGSSGSGSRVQDRLKNRLGGARTTSPGSTGSGPFAPPPQPQRGGSGDYDPYRAGGYDGGGGGEPAAAAAVPAPAPPSGGGRFGGGLPSGPRRMGGLPSGPRMR